MDAPDGEDALRDAVDGLRCLIELMVTADAPPDAIATARRHIACAMCRADTSRTPWAPSSRSAGPHDDGASTGRLQTRRI
jgi:hypothetical protein